jgi:hypothetical protein
MVDRDCVSHKWTQIQNGKITGRFFEPAFARNPFLHNFLEQERTAENRMKPPKPGLLKTRLDL